MVSSGWRQGSSRRLAPGSEPFRQVVEKTTNASLVQAGPAGNLGQRQTLTLQFQDLSARRRAHLQQVTPELVGLDDLAGSRLIGGRQLGRFIVVQRLLVLELGTVAAAVIDKVVVRHAHEKRPQVRPVRELPFFLTKAVQNVGPDRLDDIHRIKLRHAAAAVSRRLTIARRNGS